jgi:hypothetical protein
MLSADPWFLHRASEYYSTVLEFDRNPLLRCVHFSLKYFSFLCGPSMSSNVIVTSFQTHLVSIRRSCAVCSILFIASTSTYRSDWNLGPRDSSLFSISNHSCSFSFFWITPNQMWTQPLSLTINPSALWLLHLSEPLQPPSSSVLHSIEHMFTLVWW